MSIPLYVFITRPIRFNYNISRLICYYASGVIVAILVWPSLSRLIMTSSVLGDCSIYSYNVMAYMQIYGKAYLISLHFTRKKMINCLLVKNKYLMKHANCDLTHTSFSWAKLSVVRPQNQNSANSINSTHHRVEMINSKWLAYTII